MLVAVLCLVVSTTDLSNSVLYHNLPLPTHSRLLKITSHKIYTIRKRKNTFEY